MDSKTLSQLQTYKGYHVSSIGPIERDDQSVVGEVWVHQHPIPVEGEPLVGITYNPDDPTSLNKAIEEAKEWIDGQQLPAAGDVEPAELHSTNFFTKIKGTGKVDLTLRIMEVNENLTIMVDPGIRSKGITPVTVTGTPADLDERFFNEIMPGVQQLTGLVSNLPDVLKQAQEKSERGDDNDTDEEAADDKPVPKQKAKKEKWPKQKEKAKPAPKPKPEAEKIEEPSLFDSNASQ